MSIESEQLKHALNQAPEHNKGLVYAERFEEALTELIGEGKIQGFRATQQNSEDDRRGIDYWVLTNDTEHAFQITSGRQRGSRRRYNNGKRGGRYGSRKTQYLMEHGITKILLRRKHKLEFKDMALVKERILDGVGLSR